jgi:uncharacterized protein
MGEGAASLPTERVPIDAYGNMGFRLLGAWHPGSLLILPDGAHGWGIDTIEALESADLASVLAFKNEIEILLLGTGTRLTRPQPALRAAVEEAGIGLEAMDTGAACRTFNVLLAERRRVAAALIAVP